jgi:hypothetical protein
MGTPTTAELLSVSPEEAVIMMYNAAFNTTVPVKQGRASPPIDNGDGTVTVTVSMRAPLSPDETLLYSGGGSFPYPRGDLTTFFGGLVDDFIPELPTTSQTLADLIAARFGIINDQNDFMISEIPSDAQPPYILKANPNSWRWTGQLVFNANGGSGS